MRAAVHGLGAVLARKHIAPPYLTATNWCAYPARPGPVMKARFGYYIAHSAHRAPGLAARTFIDWLPREAPDERPPIPPLPAELPGLPAAEAPRPHRRPRTLATG